MQSRWTCFPGRICSRSSEERFECKRHCCSDAGSPTSTYASFTASYIMLLWRLGNKAIMWTERGQTALKHYYHGSCRAGRKDISWAWDSSDSCGRATGSVYATALRQSLIQMEGHRYQRPAITPGLTRDLCS